MLSGIKSIHTCTNAPIQLRENECLPLVYTFFDMTSTHVPPICPSLSFN